MAGVTGRLWAFEDLFSEAMWVLLIDVRHSGEVYDNYGNGVYRHDNQHQDADKLPDDFCASRADASASLDLSRTNNAIRSAYFHKNTPGMM